MKACVVLLLLLFSFFPISGYAQAHTPSIRIGTHALTLGMPESEVLAELRPGFHLQPSGTASWMISEKAGDLYELVGRVAFDRRRLTSVFRYLNIGEPAGKSLFYAIVEATQGLERDGLTSCQVSTTSKSSLDNVPSGAPGNVTFRDVLMNCGAKQVDISLSLSDAPGMVPSYFEVVESLGPAVK